MTIKSNVSLACSTQRKKKGFTLTEIAIVLGIIGLILGAVWSAASGVYASANASNFAQQMGQYVAAVRSSCGSGGCAGVAPSVSSPYPTLTGVLFNPTASTDANTPGWFILGYTNIPTSTAGQNFVQGIVQAANTIGAVLGSSLAIADVTPPSPSCSAYSATATTPVCTSPSTSFTSQYIASGGTTSCLSAATVPTGDCSLAPKVLPSTSAYFKFSPTF